MMRLSHHLDAYERALSAQSRAMRTQWIVTVGALAVAGVAVLVAVIAMAGCVGCGA